MHASATADVASHVRSSYRMIFLTISTDRCSRYLYTRPRLLSERMPLRPFVFFPMIWRIGVCSCCSHPSNMTCEMNVSTHITRIRAQTIRSTSKGRFVRLHSGRYRQGRRHGFEGGVSLTPNFLYRPTWGYRKQNIAQFFSARCNRPIYISRLCYDVSVRLSVCDGSALAHYS